MARHLVGYSPLADVSHGRGRGWRSVTVHYRLARVYDRLGKAGEAKAEHALHERLTQEENAFIRRQAGGMERLESR